MGKKVIIVKSINPIVAWGVIATAVACFLLLFIILLGDVRVTQLQQQARFSIYETQNYYGIRWVHIPGTKKPIVVPPAKLYKSADGIWLLVNKNQSLGLGYEPSNLVSPTLAIAYNNDDPTVLVRSTIEPSLKELFKSAAASGHTLTLRSAYRASSLQQTYYNQAVAGGTTEYVAKPGQSEHQTGLAIDVNNVSPNCVGCEIDNQTAAWLKDNAYKYGFIVRYQQGKESITGYSAEPWHLRYVGVLLATKLQESGLTLEEFTALITAKK